MKLFLLKILFQLRARDEGFTLPMVIALGLVMLLLGTVNIVKSNEENIAAINTNSSSDALAIAEVGIARYRQLLNQNRILALYNHQQWTSNSVSITPRSGVTRNINVAGQTCDNISNTPAGWFDDDNASTNVAPNSTAQWWQVKQSLGGDSIGEYRLVSYVYDHDNNDADNDNGQFAPDDDLENDTDFFDYNNVGSGYDPVGILTVQGRSVDEDGKPNGSEAQIQVKIPLRINDIEKFAPILWVGSGAIATPGNLNITNSANNKIILSNSGSGCSKPPDINGNDAISDARTIPFIQTIGDTITTASAASQTNGFDETDSDDDYFGGTAKTKYTTGIAGDECEAENDICYLYELNSLTITDDAEVDGAANVTVYVNGTVNISGTDVQIGSTASSDYFELYVDNGNAININTGSAGNKIDFTGLIHAPTSTLTVNGSGNLNINGSVWVGEFVNNNTTGTVTIKGDDSSTGVGASEPAYKVYTTSEFRTPRPITGNPTEWIREEVD